MEKYLLCELNDENYTDASYTFHKTYEEAKIEAIVDCVEQFDGDCEVETDNEGFRISSSQGDNFFVTEIKQIATTQ